MGLLMLQVGATIALAFFGQHLNAWAVLGWYAALFVPYAALLWGARQGSTPNTPRIIWGIIAAAVVMRLALVGAEPLLSDDIYRYVWDGRVLLAGINPYEHSPQAPQLTALRDAVIWPKINHPHLPTIYPPAAQYLFGLAAWLGGSVWILKLLLVLVELGCGLALWRSVRTRWSVERQRSALALYALNPLVIVEIAWSGHVDALAWGPLALALAWVSADDRWRAWLGAGVMLGVSVAAKFLGIIALPLLLFAPSALSLKAALGRRLATTLMVFGVVIAGYLPLLKAPEQSATGSASTYAASWRNNDGLYRASYLGALYALERMAQPSQRIDPKDQSTQVFIRFERLDALFMRLGWTKTWRGRQIPNTGFVGDQLAQGIAKLIGAFLMALLLWWCVWIIRRPEVGALWLFFGLFLIAPTVMPWYVAWLVALSALHQRPLAPLLFSGVTVAGYTSWASGRMGGAWEIPDWVVALEFGLVVMCALYELLWFKPKQLASSAPVQRP